MGEQVKLTHEALEAHNAELLKRLQDQHDRHATHKAALATLVQTHEAHIRDLDAEVVRERERNAALVAALAELVAAAEYEPMPTPDHRGDYRARYELAIARARELLEVK